MFALVVNDTIVKAPVTPPGTARRLDTNEWVSPPGGLELADVATQELCGYYLIDESAVRPADTATSRYVEAYTLVAGRPKRTWQEVVKTAGEIQNETRMANMETLVSRARAAIAANDTFINTPNASITNAQVVAHVKMLSRECTGIIRLLGQRMNQLVDLLDSTSGT